MKIEANDKEIQDIFSLGYFQIPRFQRPYSWERDEVEEFWGDIVNDKSENYFIGSMVVYQAKKPYFGIVDGQQRLTTITLILSAIRNAFVTLGEENLAHGVHKYVEKPNIDNEAEFVLDTDTSFPYFQDHIQSFDGLKIECEVGIEEQKLKNAFELIISKLAQLIPDCAPNQTGQIKLFSSPDPNSIQKLKEIRDKVLALKLVFIQLDNKDDAHLIFETLNARGRDLRTSDLVKNLLLSKIKVVNTRLDSAKESWNSLIRRFDDANDSELIDSFLLHYWISQRNYTTDKKLFSEISKYINLNDNNAQELLATLANVAPVYCRINDPRNASWTKEEFEIKESLIALKLFKVKQQSSMVLALMRSYYEKKINLRNLKIAMRKIEFFHFVFNGVTSQRSSGSIATIYSNHAIRLSAAVGNDEIQKIFFSLFDALKNKLPQFDEFEVKFLELSYLSTRTKNKGIIKYILSQQLGSQANGIDVNHDSLSIEHLISEAEIKDGVSESIVGSIGNLLLVDGRTNSEVLKNSDAVRKIDTLNEMGYPIAKSFIKRGIWTEQQIMARSKKIAAELYSSCAM
jgi:uncharacterized protein with ParB-like and HNH nuclease domain